MLKRHYHTIAFGIASLFLIIGFSLYYVQLAGVKNLIVIHFSAPRGGADFIGNTSDALGILVSGAIMTLINYALMSVFYNRDRLLAHLISMATILLAFLILIAITVIITVN